MTTTSIDFAAVNAPANASAATARAVEADEIYQLVKRGEINPHEVEVVGAHAVEVSILWKSSILHVAHINGSHDFVLSTREAKKAPADRALLSGLAAGTALISAGAAMHSYAVGAVGTLVALAGAGAGIALDAKNDATRRDASRFVVGAELLSREGDAPIVLNRAGGATTFVFLAGASGHVEIDGAKRTLADLIAAGECRTSATAPGAYEIDVKSGARYRMELGALTILARVVAPGRRVVGTVRRDPARMWAGLGAAGAVAAVVGAALFASSGDASVSNGSEDDQIAELRAFVQRQEAREPRRTPPEPTNSQGAAGGNTTGGRPAPGAAGSAGRPTATARSGRTSVARNDNPGTLTPRNARQIIAQSAIFTSTDGMIGGETGVVFERMLSGQDAQTTLSAMNNGIPGDTWGTYGMGPVGPGQGGGGDAGGTVMGGPLVTSGRDGSQVGRRFGPPGSPTVRGDGFRLPRPGRPETSPGLSAEAIRRVVQRNIGQIAHCHEQGLARNANLQGRVAVRFIIGGDGAVMGSSVAESTVADAGVNSCIASAARRWQFPSPDGGGVVTVTYPFALQPPQ